jgi:RHH-type proline utilization regulon transcriptional repressor/proline dehydrogenase/delta 1-pyrroline-5-carboxylate dehydrogenase
MSVNPLDSEEIKKAAEIIRSAHGKTLTLQEREKAAIELAAHLLNEANRIQTFKEKRIQAQLARMMRDPRGKAFTTSMTDQCFRSHKSPRVAAQLIYLIEQFGVPQYLGILKRVQLSLFAMLGKSISYLLVPVVIFMLRKETSAVILPGEKHALKSHMQKRRKEGVRLNLNHLGEAILSEEEALQRLHIYLKDLEEDEAIEYVSIKISTIFSQINLLAWEKSLAILADRLRQLYRAAMHHTFTRADGSKSPKFVNLDMEEYRDLILTKDLFKKVLEEPEFHNFSAGIVLQAYLPDSHEIQKELTEWAMRRVSQGGAPVKIRIVKGANLAMEQFEASLRGWHQAPYMNKPDVDANYKRMVSYGCQPDHAKAVHLGIASHNLFDIAFAMLERSENKVEKEISFEMLEGMADHMRRAVQKVVGDILLYCPIATKKDFQSAVAYLIRRLDENTGPENFLRYTFGLKPHTEEWDEQVAVFRRSCEGMNKPSTKPRRTQNRLESSKPFPCDSPFENEADTDFALPQNRKWAEEIVLKWNKKNIEPIPLVIAGKDIHHPQPEGEGVDPSNPKATSYRYTMASWEEVDQALRDAKAYETSWSAISVAQRCQLLSSAAHKMRERKADLIGVMMLDGGKTIMEGDPEVSEAIDFAEYYSRSLLKMDACKDVAWTPKGTILITPPWNFPVSIPAGGILAALAAGNCVIFKPAPEAVLSGWILVNALWDAGIPREVLQFINCPDDPVGSKLIADPRLNAVILTGATSTAKLFLKMNPKLDLAAETGGKNSMIITGMADRDLAIKDLIHSAFGHSGQKCSAASLAILEAEVYDDKNFRRQLKAAVESLTVGTPWDLSSKVVPLIRAPHDALLKGLTSLDPGEEWLVEPKQDLSNPNLWSPGVKLGVKEGSFMHQTELFGPVLGLMRAKDLDHAIHLANGTPYGLTSGLQSLDEREQKLWMSKIEAGNCYINRTITGAIVRRQPFGGCKASSFGNGAKAGGPNYVPQFAFPAQVSLPQEKLPVDQNVNNLINFIEKISLSAEDLGIFFASIANYSYWGKRFRQDHDPSKVVGQDNIFRYKPHTQMAFRIQSQDKPLDIFRVIAAALTCGINLDVSFSHKNSQVAINDQWPHSFHELSFTEESEEDFLKRVKEGTFKRIRLISAPSDPLVEAAARSTTYLATALVLANGRFELLHFLREVAISIDYHRYGNLGVREGELRTPVL